MAHSNHCATILRWKEFVMSRRSFGPFSGTHLTVIIVAVVAVVGLPSALFAVDAFSNVAIQDPVSGVKASVDSHHRLKTTGTVIATAAAPADLVRFHAVPSAQTCTQAYQIPAGKALVLKSAIAYLIGAPNSEIDLFSDGACSSFIGAFQSDNSRTTINDSFGDGVAVKSLYLQTQYGAGTVSGYGYLVPASAVP
jgi:hypothetical protein